MRVIWSPEIQRAAGAKGFLVLPNGDVLATRTEGRADGVFVILSRSRDGGQSWQRVGTIVSDPDPTTDLGDGNLCLRRNGELLYVYRHNRYRGDF
ncbi:MAG: glycoside hydrolase, partial [Armatimonadetes bacterium]|nr:glycoside hydrolase [Armatimonadota bacterium]